MFLVEQLVERFLESDKPTYRLKALPIFLSYADLKRDQFRIEAFADDKSDYADDTVPTELESGVLVSVANKKVKRRVVVTGGAGFIGSHLVDRLVKRDEEVIVLDNFSSGDLDFLGNSIENITLIDIDLLNEDFEKGRKPKYLFI